MQTVSDLLALDTDELPASGSGPSLSTVEAPDLAAALSSPNAFDSLLAELAGYTGAPYLIDPVLQVVAMVPGPVADLSALLALAGAVADALDGAAAECSATIDGRHVAFAEAGADVFALTIDQRQVATWYWDDDGLEPLE